MGIKIKIENLILTHDMCSQHYVGIDVLKIYSIIMVVLTHCYAPSFVQARLLELWIYNAVPVFLIVGSFLYSRKFSAICARAQSLKDAYKVWLGKKNLTAFFKRIGIPYLFFMLLQLIVLPSVGYAPFPEVLLNTIKGGMGPGGYYLVVYLQLFLLVPLLNRLFEKSPFATVLGCLCVQVAFDVLIGYLSANVSALFVDINKFISVRFFVIFVCGTAIRRYYRRLKSFTVAGCVLFGFFIAAVRNISGLTGIYAIDSALGAIQSMFWCGGIVCMLMKIFEGMEKECALVKFIAGSTLHILLFQQLYFCCVGTARHMAYIDAPVALFGGVAAFALSKAAKKAKLWYFQNKNQIKS